MALLVRSISVRHWADAKPSDHPTDITADVVTRGRCVRTENSVLSLWDIPPDNWKDAVLAILGKTGTDKLSDVDLVWLSDEFLKSHAVDLVQVDDEGVMDHLKGKHFHAIEVNLGKLGWLAKHVLDQIKLDDDVCFRVITADEVKEAYVEAIAAGIVQADKLKDKFRRGIGV